MSNISKLIKELRDKTGAGFLDCKNALSENSNDLDSAADFLRKKGLIKASKKTSREANEGAVGIYYNDRFIVLLKVNSETDFAAKSDTFLNFLDTLGDIAIKNASIDLNLNNFLNLKFENNPLSEYFNSMIAKIGENLILKELLFFENKYDNFSFYIHNSYRNNIGKIISFIKFKSTKDDENIKIFAKNLCMHIAAMKPESLDVNDLNEEIVLKEKNIQKELILNSGKSSNIADKILEGKMKKFYSEVTFYNQSYILDQDKTVKQVISDYKKEYDFSINSFHLISL
tara:strand:- start:95 stop:952 length:858 start_codon:yes stop_codon:yes gene_type:complete